MKIFVQIIGFCAAFFAAMAFQCNGHRKIMIFRTLNESLFAVQYILLGAYPGAAMNIIGSIRNITFARLVQKGKSTVPARILFSAALAVMGVVTWSGPSGILVIFAKVVTTVAYGMKNPRIIRWLTLPTSLCWLVYNSLCGSYGGIFCEALTTASILAAMVRYDLIPTLKRGKKE